MERTDIITIIKSFLTAIKPAMDSLSAAVCLFPLLNKLMTEIAKLEDTFNSPTARANQRNLVLRQRDQVDVIFGDEEIDYNDGVFDDEKSYRVFLLNRIVKTYPGMVYSVEDDYPRVVIS